MHSLPLLDVAIIVLYLIAMILVGVWFSRKNKSSEQFTKASGMIPGWAVGISLYATFLSSNTFLGVPGKAFGSNWNALVFSLSMPLAAWVAVKYFVPFYRTSGGVSAYSHLEHRFGAWARTYAMVCFLLTQLARMGSIFFGIALSLQALTGYDMTTIMMVTGICIVVYTVMGGIEAVIWTEVVQGVLLTFGGLLILYLIITNVDGGVSKIIDIGMRDKKFSLGTLDLDFVRPSFWVILLYGFFINLNNFGMDQNYVQRYHAATSAKEAAKSVWLCVRLYIPISLLFFIIGAGLYAYYVQHPELTDTIRLQAAAERLPSGASQDEVVALSNTLKAEDYGDKVMPHFMVSKVPLGLLGLVISAIMAAAMSTISSGMNASATVFTEDIYKRYIHPSSTNKQALRVLFIATAVFGVLGIITGISMIGVKSILDVWWELSGIFAGGMLGLFLLGIISKKAGNSDAVIAVIVGVLAILWMTFSYLVPGEYSYLRYPLHANMIIVVGTLVISLVGSLLANLRKR
ncbi:sodium:solute symporter [Parapedobacter tibetensis]|uniref:sodium:solute symporter n=1 Tax=Parapedobacter tibetensis TaxID=2972951 RepID=UPI00214D4787|nr:sodium:solute symporter [Parapedobacter tibetensis]